MARTKSAAAAHLDPAQKAIEEAKALLMQEPLFQLILPRLHLIRPKERNPVPEQGFGIVDYRGTIWLHPTRRATPQEWMHVIAHLALHACFGHFQLLQPNPREWNAACCLIITRFLADMKVGQPPVQRAELPAGSEQQLFNQFVERGIPELAEHCSMAGPFAQDMRRDFPIFLTLEQLSKDRAQMSRLFARAVEHSLEQAMLEASGRELDPQRKPRSNASKALHWVVSNYPLLSALATSFQLIEAPDVCMRLDISIAAVDARGKTLYANPAAALSEAQWRFVMAHELLHVALRHQARQQGRDPFLWNLSADYVVNSWLAEMEVGEMPDGLMLDPDLRGLSAERVYERMTGDLRIARRLKTFRGDKPDMLGDDPEWWTSPGGMTLDELYRKLLTEGYLWHCESGRGTLPAGLTEEIRSLYHPPIPWDVELGYWFDEHFPEREQRRTYARLSRRQSATPDIPRPRTMPLPSDQRTRTFGVVLDTSGSMDPKLLGLALGAVASYAQSHSVPAVRLVFCDAQAYDEGFVEPELMLDRLRVKGRGGTILQPGIELLERAEDFPKDAPILVITDTWCDILTIHRQHAFLIPNGQTLPFAPHGPVFRVRAR